MPRGIYPRKPNKKLKKTAVIPLDAIPERPVRAAVVRRKPHLEVAQLQLAAEVVLVLQTILNKAA